VKTLVLGLGKPILGDDSMGFRVVQQLKARFDKAIPFQEKFEGADTGVPAKTKFLWGKKPLQSLSLPLRRINIKESQERRSLSYITDSPSPYQGEGDKGDRVTKHKPDLTLVESSASGLGLLDLITGYDKVIIIDAIKTQGGEAGKIYRLGAENLGAIRHSASPHDINLATALELGKKLGAALPQQIIIFAIEVVEVTTFSEKCTPEVEKAIPLAASMVAEGLNSG